MDYLFISTIINTIIIYYLITKTDKLQKQINELKENTMKDLENFYNNHYKTVQMMDWSELTEKQKNALEKSSEYWKYQLDKAKKDFRVACIKEMEKLIDVVKKCR